jgi:UDP-N-acetylmuramate-alanine ligase
MVFAVAVAAAAAVAAVAVAVAAHLAHGKDTASVLLAAVMTTVPIPGNVLTGLAVTKWPGEAREGLSKSKSELLMYILSSAR